MAEFYIDDVIVKGNGSPVIVAFQNGYPTDSFKTEPCTVLEDVTTDTKLYATELDGLLYTGKDEVDVNLKTLILARDKLTGKVRLIETKYVEMQPVLDIDLDNQFYETSNLELIRKFGSKKQKQQMEQREKLKVYVETVTEQMRKVTKCVKEEQLDLASYTANDAEDFYIPPIDRSAQSAETVYSINKILTHDEYEQIASQLEDKDYKSEMFLWLQSLISNKELTSKQRVLAVYANSLLKLYNTVAKEITKKTFSACPFSSTLNEVILKNFTFSSYGKIMRPGPYRDKALCYAIVLILLINKLKFDLDSFCQAFKLTANNASMKVRTTGATVVNRAGKKVVQLKLPLNNKSGFRRKSAKF